MITLLLVSLFSFLTINLVETKSIQSKNLENQYLYIQGKNHLSFLQTYIVSLSKDELDTIEHIIIENKNFVIEAYNNDKNNNYELELFVKSKFKDISLFKKVTINK